MGRAEHPSFQNPDGAVDAVLSGFCENVHLKSVLVSMGYQERRMIAARDSICKVNHAFDDTVLAGFLQFESFGRVR